MAPLTASPQSLTVGLSSPPASPTHANIKLSPASTPASNSGAGRGRRASLTRAGGSVQSRRSAASLGLGVSFAPLLDIGALQNKSPQSPSVRDPSRSTSRSHSRRSSLTSPGSIASTSGSLLFELETSKEGLPPTVASAVSATRSNSRQPSRRPSLSHLASFLSGIEHHTRVRSPGVGGGRGVSRSASRSASRASTFRRRTGGGGGADQDSDGEDLDFDEEEAEDYGFRRTSRRSSLSSRQLHSLVRENTTGATDAPSTPSALADRLSGALGLNNPSPPPQPQRLPRTFRSLSTPRVLSTSMDEEPFLDSTPSSPQPRERSRTLDSNDSYLSEGGLHGVDVFEEGERVGVGVWLESRGGWVTDCFADSGDVPGNGIGGPGVLEVERRLGEGTYAIVYLVREVLYDPDPNDDDLLSPIDAFTSFQFSPESPQIEGANSRPRLHSWASDVFSPPSAPTYGRSFALKCLCKKDLTEDLIEVQRGEAVLHRALPDHPYIVRLYGAFETAEWLFLVLEYCPGQDLFYWLDERRDDSAALYDLHSQATTPFQRHHHATTDLGSDEDDAHLSRTITASHPHLHEAEFDQTPPNPYLLSSTANNTLLSRARLRLISRMFNQMCSAVQACHDVGISHRDIKPENFIVMDGRGENEGGAARVVVKITDWGLGTREEMCEDFDCGSKPYMAYECRNNLQPTYDPRQADVWSLGLVLLNLLYHRNPWADPRLDDPDFAEYVSDPVGFLEERFEGLGEEVATFLAEKVFCDVLEQVGDPPQLRRRVTAGEFGKWAGRLVMMMGEGKRKRASVSDQTFSLVSAVQRPTATPSPTGSTGLASMLAHYSSTPTPTSHLPPPHPLSQSSTGYSDEIGTELAPVTEVEEDKSALATPVVSPGIHPLEPAFRFAIHDDDDPLPSPSFSPPPVASPTLGNSPPVASPIALSPAPPSALTAALNNIDKPVETPSPASPKSLLRPRLDALQQTSANSGMSTETDNSPQEEPSRNGDVRCWGENDQDTLAAKSKRRKRGARKSKTVKSADNSPPTPSPLSPGSPTPLDTVVEGRDQFLDELAAASQDLARELSKAAPKHQSRSTSTPGTRSLGTSTAGSIKSSSTQHVSRTEPIIPTVAKKATKSGGMFGRFKTLVDGGNPDLEAFRQRAAERNGAIGANADTYSAPAKMQGRHNNAHGRSNATPLSSFESVGTASWSSNRSGSEYNDDTQPSSRRAAGGDRDSPGHWNSTSSRRERLDKQRRALSPSGASAQTNGVTNSSFDSRGGTPLSNNSPLSSFSSIGGESRGRSSGSKDWRQPSPHRSAQNAVANGRQYSRTRNGANDVQSHGLAPALPIVKPVMKDSAVDTADLGAAATTPRLSGSPATIRAGLPIVPSVPLPMAAKPTRPNNKLQHLSHSSAEEGTIVGSASTATAPIAIRNPTVAPIPIAVAAAQPIPANQHKPTKFGKMFSVFNSGGVGKAGRGKVGE